jgi:hypothetical protein
MGHWYKLEDGQPLYTVPMANGKGERDTTLRDARKLRLVPSVTSIMGLIDKPMLYRWKAEQLLKAVYENPFRYKFEDDWEKHKSKLYGISEKVGKDAAEIGNKIHDALENYYLGNGLDGEMRKICVPVIKFIDDTFGVLKWIPEESFSHKLGFGGKCDLHIKACDKCPDGIILDFKTKSADDFSKVKAYPEQCQQVSAYREGLGVPAAKCYNLFIGSNSPGQLLLHEWTEEECQKAWECFKHLVGYWRLINNFEIS